MTRDELNRRRMMFQIYSNRNKMPQLQKNTNEEPVAHSATNDFLEYRKKVAAGTRMQRENNKSNLFNVTAANEQYHQDLMDQNIIIHAGMNNQYIAKLDDFYGKGKPRYFYDQTEWDNYRKNMQGTRQAGADRGAREGADAKNKALANKAQEAFTKSSADYKNKELANKAQEAFTKSSADYKNKELANKAQEAFTKSSADYKNKDLADKAQEAFNNSPAANTEFRTSTDAYKNKELLADNQKSKENAIKKSDPEYQKELEKASTIKADKERWGAYTTKEISSLVNDDKRFSNIKTADDAVNYPGGVEKLYNDLEAALEEKYPGKKKNYEASKNAGADKGAKEKENAEKDVKKSPKTLADDYTTDNASYKAMVSEVSKAIKNGEVIMVGDAPRPVMDSNWKISENGQKAYDAWKKVMNEVNDAASDTENYSEFKGQILNNLKKDLSEAENKKSAKHSSLEDGITTSDDITSDQEYLNFRARVEAGMKHFGMTRGLMSVPVNQALKNGESLSHAGIPASYKKLATGLNNMKNHGYYNKIDNAYGPGKPRYFYSKDEWDAYQREKNKLYDKAKADVKARNEAAEAARPKSNVEQAQYARQQEEKKGQREIQRQQEEGINKRTNNSVKVVDDILDTIKIYSHNKEIGHKIDELREKYNLKAAGYGDGPYKYHQDKEYRKLMDPYVKGDKNITSSENINSDNDFNRMSQIEHEYSQKYYKDLMNDVKDIVSSDPKNAEWIMYQLMGRSSVKNAMNNSDEVYDEIIKALKELNVSTAGFKPIEVKEIEVKPIEVKKIK